MAPEPKRRKIDDATSRMAAASSLAEKKDISAAALNRSTAADVVQSRGVNPRIQQAKNYAVAQAQQEVARGTSKSSTLRLGIFLCL